MSTKLEELTICELESFANLCRHKVDEIARRRLMNHPDNIDDHFDYTKFSKIMNLIDKEVEQRLVKIE